MTEEQAAAADEPEDAASDPDDGGQEPESAAPDEELVERVAEADAEELAQELTELRARTEELEAELANERERADDLESKLKRKQADFQNFKKRQQQKTEEARRRATEDLVERLIDVRDNLVRALEQEEGADIRDGVETTLRGFDDVLDAEGVATIEPAPGEELDPVHHEALMRVESDQPPGTVAQVHRPGYEMAGKVLRPAQVTVTEASDEDGETTADEDGETAADG